MTKPTVKGNKWFVAEGIEYGETVSLLLLAPSQEKALNAAREDLLIEGKVEKVSFPFISWDAEDRWQALVLRNKELTPDLPVDELKKLRLAALSGILRYDYAVNREEVTNKVKEIFKTEFLSIKEKNWDEIQNSLNAGTKYSRILTIPKDAHWARYEKNEVRPYLNECPELLVVAKLLGLNTGKMPPMVVDLGRQGGFIPCSNPEPTGNYLYDEQRREQAEMASIICHPNRHIKGHRLG